MTNCDACVNYEYDEDYECYCCTPYELRIAMGNLDEDEMYRFLSGTQQECPYFRLDDEYAVVRHQM
mgnify:CR=1 FL=1